MVLPDPTWAEEGHAQAWKELVTARLRWTRRWHLPLRPTCSQKMNVVTPSCTTGHVTSRCTTCSRIKRTLPNNKCVSVCSVNYIVLTQPFMKYSHAQYAFFTCTENVSTDTSSPVISRVKYCERCCSWLDVGTQLCSLPSRVNIIRSTSASFFKQYVQSILQMLLYMDFKAEASINFWWGIFFLLKSQLFWLYCQR